jgi:uncharacterized membrane protein YbhN (UPF0104 family)
LKEKTLKGCFENLQVQTRKSRRREKIKKNKKVIDIKTELAALEVIVWPSRDAICVTQTTQSPVMRATYALIIFLIIFIFFQLQNYPSTNKIITKKTKMKIQKCHWT